MNKYIISITLLYFICNNVYAKIEIHDINKSDTISHVSYILKEVVVKANNIPVSLKNYPGSVSLVSQTMLSDMPKSISADDAFRLVPGVRIDNQNGGERVHLSIRGQGILTERGLRGICIFIDGIPLNDPSGFVPDLYDLDWATVKKVEVFRGPAAGLYGGSCSGGVLNIYTKNGGPKPLGGEVIQTLGSNGFSKSLIQLDGSEELMDYRVSFSRTDGNGYRDHQAFWGNKLYEKINFYPSAKLTLTQIISHVDYFIQNPEGLNLGQFDDLSQANPDARPFNEYQKTNRILIGFHGNYKFSDIHDIDASSYFRPWSYKETSNHFAEYRDISNSGAVFQYNLHFGSSKLKNNFSIGFDYSYQNINMHKFASAANPKRVESIDETNIETDSLLANQIIFQKNIGPFALYKMEFGKLTFMANVRYDVIKNSLTNKMMALDTNYTEKNFSKTSEKVGLSYNFADAFTLFSNFGQGFIPPSTEELASNPVGYSGFNTHLVPGTSISIDFGGRGFAGDRFYYEITGFLLNTENDFFRFKQSSRGNQEVFYGNAGNSRRIGVETFLSYQVIKNCNLQIAYTYANYKYTSATIDPVYTDTAYVLTTPPAAGQYLPNSPQHQIYAQAVFSIGNHFKISLSTELQSKWAIYTDKKAYNGELDTEIYKNWQDGFNLFHAKVSYQFHLLDIKGECSLFIRNITDEKYMAFTEPDPDGNSYHPGPGREIFGSINLRF